MARTGRRNARLCAAVLTAGLLAACAPAPPQDVRLFTSLPILWGESDSLAGVIDAQPHWVAEALRAKGSVVALDSLEGLEPDGTGLLILAQPRPLSPAENVALDEWVAGGGHVLLFADPLLTEDSGFALGDRRRPEGTVLLSPILRRWGLELLFDESQPAGQRAVQVFGEEVPVELAGQFLHTGRNPTCRVEGKGLAAWCRVGKGSVLAIADAALLDAAPEGRQARRAVLMTLIGKARTAG